ncbi:MAG: hypothetical protein COA73_07140 [Candidatus Hydrogenedentota bacterium]|nr:MAG: hypothetical protein COA73_07140 [Candidatus Hydrogenedentota bacterium]
MDDKPGLYIGLGVSLGISLGIAFGTAIDNIGLGIALGISLGTTLGIVAWMVMSSDSNMQPEEDQTHVRKFRIRTKSNK